MSGEYFPKGEKDKLPADGIFRSSNIALYSYASLNPIRMVDPDGNLSLDAAFTQGREDPGVLTVRDDFGNVRGQYQVLGRGTGGRDQTVQNADTPTGTYSVGDVEDTSTWSQDSYGSSAVRLTPESGTASESGRSGILIHGGREATSDSAWDTSYRSNHPTRGGLRATHGCLRMSNSDQASLTNLIKDIRAERNTFSYKAKAFVYSLFGKGPDQNDKLNVRDTSE